MEQIKRAIKISRKEIVNEHIIKETRLDNIEIEFDNNRFMNLLEWINSVEKRLHMCGTRMYIDNGKAKK